MNAPLKIAQVLNLLFHSRSPDVDAVFIPRIPVISKELEEQVLNQAVRLVDSHQARHIVLGQDSCLPNVSYSGFASRHRFLSRKLDDVDRDPRCIIEITPSEDFSTEFINFCKLASIRGWKSIILVTQAPFALGTMQQAIHVMKELGMEYMQLFPKVPSPVDWNSFAPSRSGSVSTDLFGHISADFDSGSKIASIDDVIKHIRFGQSIFAKA